MFVSQLATSPVFKRPVIARGTSLAAISAALILFCFFFQKIILQQALFSIFDADFVLFYW